MSGDYDEMIVEENLDTEVRTYRVLAVKADLNGVATRWVAQLPEVGERSSQIRWTDRQTDGLLFPTQRRAIAVALRAQQSRPFASTTSPYGWVVLHYVDAENGRVTLVSEFGPSTIDDTKVESLVNGEGVPFRMWDDDWATSCEGLLIGDVETYGFTPLDDFGRGAFGMTCIEYLNDTDEGRWVRL